MSDIAQLDAIINAALSAATEAQTAAQGYTDQAQTAASSSIQNIGDAPDVDEIDLAVPLFINPGEDLSQDFKTQYDLALGQIDGDLAGETTDFLNNWFPDLTACIKTNVSSWLCDAINGGVGLPAAVMAQLWGQARDREARATSQALSQSIDKYGGMGWDLGSEYIANVGKQIVVEGGKAVSELNRTISIEEAKLRIETAKFAIEQAINLRLGILRALVDFLNMKIRMYGEARDKATAYVDAKRRLWESVQAYYRAIIDAKELLLKGQIANQAKDLEIVKYGVQAIVAVIENRTRAAVAAADTMGDIASSARGAINALAHEGHITNAEG